MDVAKDVVVSWGLGFILVGGAAVGIFTATLGLCAVFVLGMDSGPLFP